MPQQGFSLRSSAFENGAEIPVKYTCDGDDVSPRLEWSAAPEQTRSFALVVDDPDAPDGNFTHCMLYDLPAQLTELPEGAAPPGKTGRNDFEEEGYGGPCPPPGHGEHRYFFRLHALDVETLDLADKATRADFDKAIEGHVIATAELMGRFSRT